MVAYLISDEGNISLVLKGRQYFVNSTDEAHASIMDAIRNKKTEDEILLILDKTTQVQDYLEDSEVQVKDGCVVYQGEEVHNTLTEKILSFMRQGLPVQPLINFLKNMMKNPVEYLTYWRPQRGENFSFFALSVTKNAVANY